MTTKYVKTLYNNRQPVYDLQYEGGQPVLEKPLTANEVDVQKGWLYDTVRFLREVWVRPQTIKLFRAGIGQQTHYINVPNIQYTKHKGDTSLESGNFLSGQAFDIANIQVAISRRYFSLTPDQETLRAQAASSNPTGIPNITTEPELIAHLQDTAILTTKYGGSDKQRESGLLKLFPTSYGVLAALGGLAQNKAANGFGKAQPLLAVRRIGDKQNIDVEIEILEPFIPYMDFQIQVIHDGKLYRPVA
ncbi:MAG: hypothetical protein RML33_11150 [Acidobacteriota bacterium]|nr:hypothetical protein [Leptospiraceae bacterium]MDW8305377.1 hypothetical protein [Acidobacteriota bacterium]